MRLRVLSFAAALLAATTTVTLALQCRQITRSTFIETRHPNGAVTMDRVKEGDTFIVHCAPEGSRVWCYVTEIERTVFTTRRFLEADRLEWGHSQIVDFNTCLAN
jgi:hypothetical protein